MMERAFAHHDLDWRYLTLDIRPDDLQAAISGMRAMRFRGANLATPHKLEVVPLLDELAESATLSQAVNCIRREDDKLVGENTEGPGFLQALDGHIELQSSNVVLFGAGGAARAIAVELAKAGCGSITIVNRSRERGEALVELLNANFQPPEVSADPIAEAPTEDQPHGKADDAPDDASAAEGEAAPSEDSTASKEAPSTETSSVEPQQQAEAAAAETAQQSDADAPSAEPENTSGRAIANYYEWTDEYDIPAGTHLVINATTIGQFDPNSRLEIAADSMEGVTLAVDIAISPTKTRFLLEAVEHGCQALDCVGMLAQQAAIAFELWTGVKPDVDVVQDALEEFFGV